MKTPTPYPLAASCNQLHATRYLLTRYAPCAFPLPATSDPQQPKAARAELCADAIHESLSVLAHSNVGKIFAAAQGR